MNSHEVIGVCSICNKPMYSDQDCWTDTNLWGHSACLELDIYSTFSKEHKELLAKMRAEKGE